MNKTSRFLILIPAALLLLGLSACGNKGPLVMPQKPVPIEEQEVTPEDQPAADPAADKKADEAIDDATGGDGVNE
ncbi:MULTISPECIES: lipoprotein [unclassified Stenotrophomonas]|uniref:LPS translocon maturation chaperone LptM n=1 Tax=unclassified Stenotrophomonas TaxID=196198 RepID=UPI0025FCB8F2|nr:MULTISPECIES: lipoprotein [unclassified Stenotrophomonas]